ncbi:hypothetical protein CEW87_02705 [Parazoarcus communis]|uniref:Uncharacterized protein n=1 Tax=Parazoarcus communis TaxID=41977 RepID=A0A2U8GXB5_9RHOO|nr:hypothetical protein CEW87_02705 [Parazoarcus communis]
MKILWKVRVRLHRLFDFSRNDGTHARRQTQTGRGFGSRWDQFDRRGTGDDTGIGGTFAKAGTGQA